MEHVQMLHIITTAVYWVQDQGNRGNDSVSFKAAFEWSSGDVGGDLEFCIQDCEKKLTTFCQTNQCLCRYGANVSLQCHILSYPSQ